MSRLVQKINEYDAGKRAVALTMSILFLIMAGSGSFLLSKIFISGTQNNISDHVSLLHDTSRSLTIEGAVKAGDAFVANDQFEVCTLEENAVYWIRIEPVAWEKHQAYGDRALFLDHPNYIELEGYWVEGSGRIEQLPVDKRFISPYFLITEEIPSDGTIYIKVNSLVGAYKVHMASLEDYFTLQMWLMIYMLFSIGIIFAIFILDMALALILKEIYFAYYAVFLAIAQLYMYTSSGLSRISIGLEGYWFFAFGFGTLGAALLFIYGFLDLKTHFPKISRSYQFLIGLSGVGIAATIGFVHKTQSVPYLYKYLMALGLVVSIWALATLVYFSAKKHVISTYFLVGSLLQAGTIPLLILGASGLVAENEAYKLTYMLAGAINAIYFTLGIIEQLRGVREKNALFYELATTDKLTGANNRYDFDTHLEDRLQMAQRSRSPLTLMIFDIDHFKQVNDRFGHDVGDQVLREMVRIARQQLRKSEKIYRWGGEEFAILLEHTNAALAVQLAERLRGSVDEHEFKTVGHITISLGLAELEVDETAADWFKRVDQALYRAKQGGRNRVEIN